MEKDNYTEELKNNRLEKIKKYIVYSLTVAMIATFVAAEGCSAGNGGAFENNHKKVEYNNDFEERSKDKDIAYNDEWLDKSDGSVVDNSGAEEIRQENVIREIEGYYELNKNQRKALSDSERCKDETDEEYIARYIEGLKESGLITYELDKDHNIVVGNDVIKLKSGHIIVTYNNETKIASIYIINGKSLLGKSLSTTSDEKIPIDYVKSVIRFPSKQAK